MLVKVTLRSLAMTSVAMLPTVPSALGLSFGAPTLAAMTADE